MFSYVDFFFLCQRCHAVMLPSVFSVHYCTQVFCAVTPLKNGKCQKSSFAPQVTLKRNTDKVQSCLCPIACFAPSMCTSFLPTSFSISHFNTLKLKTLPWIKPQYSQFAHNSSFCASIVVLYEPIFCAGLSDVLCHTAQCTSHTLPAI